MLFKDKLRANLGLSPSPLLPLIRFGQEVGCADFYIKRDDLAPLGMGGNKLRNLEFLLGEALEQQCDIILVAGGLQSNQCRLTAAACARLGLECMIIHNDERPLVYQGNMLLNHLMGVKALFLGRVTEQERGEYVRKLMAQFKAQGRRPYLVEQCALGSLGYASAAEELFNQQGQGVAIEHVGIVGAMGGTAAGFAFGTALLGKPFHVHIISVEYTACHLRSIMAKLWDEMIQLTGLTPALELHEVATIYDEYLGSGYAMPTEESLQTARVLACTEGVFVENVYNAKTLHGLTELIRQGIIPPNKGVCFIHTGGTPALFAQAEAWQSGEGRNGNAPYRHYATASGLRAADRITDRVTDESLKDRTKTE